MDHLLVLLVNRAHQSRGWRKGFVHEDEDGLLRCELDALANHVNELSDRQVLQYGMVWKTGEKGWGEGKEGSGASAGSLACRGIQGTHRGY